MILYGARGHAKVVYDLILSNNHLLEYLVDDQPHDEFPHRLNIYKPTRELIEDKKVISPQTNLEREELRKALIERLDELNENERLVITLYYYEKLTLKEIGKVLEISESRVSQIHSKAIIKLRSKLMTSFGDYGDIF